MKRVVVNVLAFVGALTLFNVIMGSIPRWSYDGASMVVMGPGNKPAAGAPVFLNRGRGPIERYLTDSAGRLTLPIAYEEVERAVWMVCVPGGIPMISQRRRDLVGPQTYGYTTMPPGDLWPARSWGWYAPIPRGCAADSTYLWRFPPEAGKHEYAASRVEPDWDSYRKR